MLPLPQAPRQVVGGGYPAYPADDLTLAGFWGILRRHRVMIALSVGITLVLVGAYTLLSTPVYDAKSVLQFEPERVNVPTLLQELTTENEIGTEIEVLQGRTAATAVIDSLGLRARVRAPRVARSSGLSGLLGLPRRPRVSELFALLRVAPGADKVTLELNATPGGRFTISPSAAAGKPVSAKVGDTVRVAGVTLALLPGA